jgi:hypothetical protein
MVDEKAEKPHTMKKKCKAEKADARGKIKRGNCKAESPGSWKPYWH